MFSRIKLIAVIILVSVSMGLFSETITLDDAINIALKQSDDILTAKEDLKNSKYRFREALANAFPKIDASLTAVHKAYTSNDLYDQQEDKALDGEISIVQPLWVGGKVGTGIKIAKVYSKLSKESLEMQKAKTCVAITQSFNDVLLAKEAYEVIKATKTDALENLRVAETMYAQELISEYEVIKARVGVKSIEPMLVEYNNNYRLALNKFKTDLGMELDADLVLDGKLEYNPVLPDTTNYLQRVLDNRRELSILKKSNKMYRQSKRIAYGDLLPTIAAVGSFTSQASQDEFSDMFKDDFNIRKFNVGINISIPLFHGDTYAKIQQAKSSIRKSDIELRKAKRLLQLEAESTYRNLLQASEQISLQEDVVNESQKALDIANVRFSNGIGSQIEVIDAQTNLRNSRLQLLSAIHNFTNSVIEFKYASGLL